MSSAMAQAIPPSQQSFVNGQNVYQSTRLAAVINDSGQDLPYSLDAVLSDSLGNQHSLPTQSLVAPGSGSQSSTSPTFYPRARRGPLLQRPECDVHGHYNGERRGFGRGQSAQYVDDSLTPSIARRPGSRTRAGRDGGPPEASSARLRTGLLR